MKNQNKFKITIAILTIVLSLGLMLSGCKANPTMQELQSQQEATASQTSTTTPTEVEKQLPEEQSKQSAASYVMLDINPSIKLTIQEGEVTAVEALNDDGEEIILQSDVLSLAVHDAVDKLIGELGNQGYITEQEEASLVITVSGEDDELAEGLKDIAEECVEELNVECEVISATVSDEDIEEAKAVGMSAGRYLVIQQIAEEEGISLTEAIEKYVNCKMEELLGMIEDIEEIFEDDEELEKLLDGLLEEQVAVLNAALDTYEETVMNAQQAFNQAGEDALKLFEEGRNAALEAFEADKDEAKFKQAIEDLKAKYYKAKAEAEKIAEQAKKDAEHVFNKAVADIDLTEDEIADLLYFEFDFEWIDDDCDDECEWEDIEDDDFDDDVEWEDIEDDDLDDECEWEDIEDDDFDDDCDDECEWEDIEDDDFDDYDEEDESQNIQDEENAHEGNTDNELDSDND